jgi:hypothetical protein
MAPGGLPDPYRWTLPVDENGMPILDGSDPNNDNAFLQFPNPSSGHINSQGFWVPGYLPMADQNRLGTVSEPLLPLRA